MLRPLRLVAGWTIALAVALLLNLALPRTITAPEGGTLSGGAPSSSPAGVAPSPDGTPDVLPPVVVPPGGGIGSGSGRPLELTPLSAEQAAALQAATDRARVALGLDALSVGVSVSGASGWAGASGLARDGITRLDGTSPFAIASITKTFTATLTLQLIGEGRLSLRDEVAELLPGVTVPQGVKVAHLLRHTSGIADLLAPLRDRLNAKTERIWQPEDVVASVGSPWFAPGRAWAYSNTNYVLLGMIVERITGRPIDGVLRERLLAPLELTGTGMLLGEGAPYLMVPSWVSAFGTSGSMYANAHDLLRWGDALYGGGVLGATGMRHMLDFTRRGYGMGAERIRVDDAPGYGHSGLLRGFTSLLVHLPTEDLTLVVMGTTNTFDPALVLSHRDRGQPSILDLARQAVALQAAA